MEKNHVGENSSPRERNISEGLKNPPNKSEGQISLQHKSIPKDRNKEWTKEHHWSMKKLQTLSKNDCDAVKVGGSGEGLSNLATLNN